MQRNRWLKVFWGLALAGLMMEAVPAFAQGRSQGQWGPGKDPCGQGMGWSQGQGQGPGSSYGNCPNNGGYQNCRRNSDGSQTCMGRRGPRGGGRNYQSTPQNYPTPVTQ